MDTSNRSKIMTAVLIALAAATVWVLYGNSKPTEDKPTASNYYHGVMRNKKDPNIWGDDNGKQVPPPPDAIPYVPRDDTSGGKGDTKKPGAGGKTIE